MPIWIHTAAAGAAMGWRLHVDAAEFIRCWTQIGEVAAAGFST